MDYASLRNFKDFLQLYNAMSEMCFARCINTFNGRDLTKDEEYCVDVCAKKHINVNHKVMEVYMEVQPQIANKRIEEMNEAQAALEKSKNAQVAEQTNASSDVVDKADAYV